MPVRITVPKAFLIAETKVDNLGMWDALDHLGVPEWVTETDSDAELLTEFAGKLCYASFDTKLNDNLTKVGTRNNHDYIQNGIIGHYHGSVLEHSSVTFLLADVSRIVTHELVRHRAGTAFSQTSGRYVRTDDVTVYLPDDISENPDLVEIFVQAITDQLENISEMVTLSGIDDKSFDVKKRLTSAFRRILGNGVGNNIVVSANHRAWRHMLEARTDPAAEEEIRVIFADISRQLRAKYPAIYADAEISVVRNIEVTSFKYRKV